MSESRILAVTTGRRWKKCAAAWLGWVELCLHMCLLTTCDHMSNSARRLTSQFTWSLLERVDCWRPPADETHHKAPPKPRHTHTVSHPIPTAPKKFEEVANHTMEGAIALNRCYGPALRQVGRVRSWCWRASFRLDILMFIATSFEPYHTSLSSVNIC